MKNENTKNFLKESTELYNRSNPLTCKEMVNFLNREIAIYQKFTPPTVHDYTSEKFTSLIVNFMEEFNEFCNALDELVNYKKCINPENNSTISITDSRIKSDAIFNEYFKNLQLELIDMMCYLGTITIIYEPVLRDGFSFDMENINTRLFDNKSYNFKKCLNLKPNLNQLINFLDEDIRESVEKIYLSTLYNLIELRTCFKERKWHKPLEEDTSAGFAQTMDRNIKTVCVQAFVLLFEVLLDISVNMYYISGDVTTNLCNYTEYDIELKHRELLNVVYYKCFNDIFAKQQITLDL